MSYVFVYSLNTELSDDEYEQRTGVGVSVDYYEHANGGTVMYKLAACNGDSDAGWSKEDFLRYWDERAAWWQEQLNDGDVRGSTVLRAWMGKQFTADEHAWMGKQFTADACCIAMAA